MCAELWDGEDNTHTCMSTSFTSGFIPAPSPPQLHVQEASHNVSVGNQTHSCQPEQMNIFRKEYFPTPLKFDSDEDGEPRVLDSGGRGTQHLKKSLGCSQFYWQNTFPSLVSGRWRQTSLGLMCRTGPVKRCSSSLTKGLRG